jgi:hypothetical protein
MLGLSAQLATVDRLLDDPRFVAPFRAHFAPLLGRPSIPIDTYLRMMFSPSRPHGWQGPRDTPAAQLALSHRRPTAAVYGAPAGTHRGCSGLMEELTIRSLPNE